MVETILQHWVVSRFILPFLLIFFIVFGILEKTKLFGEDKHRLNAMLAFVIGLIFVAAVSPTLIVNNLILVLTVAIVVVFLILILWGFAVGEPPQIKNEGLKRFVGIVFVIGALAALLWAAGVQGGFFDFLFRQSWSADFWTNFAFIAVIIVALALVLRKDK